MNLALDIGNTRTKIGLFEGNTLLEQAIWTDWTLGQLQAFGNRHGVKRVIVSSVAEKDEALMAMLEREYHTMELTHRTALPFENRYRTPETLGKDRLAGVAGALRLYPGKNCLVVDCGTCIKYDVLTSDGVYHGGNIAPGAWMRIQAMHHFTARLPEVEMRMPGDITGFSTETALQNGALRGAALEIEGFVQLFATHYGALKPILTGGDAAFFKPLLNLKDQVTEPDLTLIGLNHILQHHIEIDKK